jgi:hypothetical protein
MTHAEIFIAIGCSLHGELEDGVKGIVEGGLLEGFVHDEVEVVGRAGGVGLESLFEALLAAAKGEKQEGGEEDEEVFHIVGDIMGSRRWLRWERDGRGAGYRGVLSMHGEFEEGEVDGAVSAEFLEVRVGREVGVLAMFEDKETLVGEPAVAEDEVGELVKVGERIGRVSEDEVEGRGRRNGEEAEDVATHELMVVAGDVELFGDLLDELLLGTTLFDADNVSGTSAEQFEADATCSAEEVEGATAFEGHAALEDVEEGLFGKVGSGACLEVAGRVEAASAVLAGDYFQINRG